MPAINKILRVNIDPQKNPSSFLTQLNLVLSQIMQTMDEVKGFRSTVTVYQTVDLQGNLLRFNGTDYLRRNTSTGKLQFWDPDAGVEGEWKDLIGLVEVDRLTSQSVEGGNTLVLTDSTNNQHLTGNYGDLYIEPDTGNVRVQNLLASLVSATNYRINPTFADVTALRALDTVYQNTESTFKVCIITVRLEN